MGESDRSDDAESESLVDRLGRRKLIGGVLVTLGGVVVLERSPSDEHLTQAESRLADLATTVDETPLANPQQSRPLRDEVASAIESVNDTLAQEAPDDDETTRRIAALKAATAYYTRLVEALDTAVRLRSGLAGSERAVLDHDGPLPYDPVTEFDTTVFAEQIPRLAESETGTVTTPRGRSLVPDQQRVVDALREQREVYDRHITAQQTYLDTSATIEEGMRAYEQSRFGAARSTLGTARDTLTAGAPSSDEGYRLFGVGLSLAQYTTIFALRRRGVTRLLEVCDSSLSARERRSGANDALDRFFEARDFVIGRDV